MPKNTLLYQDIFDWLDGRHIEQKSDNYSEERKLNHEWTSEDWSMLCDIRRYIEGTGCSSGITNQERAAWLCELPKRFSLEGKEQKPAEWSDEDEQRIAEIEFAVMQMNTKRVDTKDKCLNWLKSLRPQSHWKPSEEQMGALKNVAFGNYQNGDGPVLRGLYGQLKRLM